MKNIYTFRILVVALATLFSLSSIAQGKAKIYIKKNENGKVSEETHDIDITEGQDIETLLKEMGILDEFGQLKDGQSFTINIDKTEGLNNQNINMFVVPPSPESPLETWRFEQSRAFLGVMLKETIENNNGEATTSGAVISEIIPETSAEEAGLLAGDIIREIDNHTINNVSDAVSYIQSKEAGDKITIEVERDGKMKKVSTKLGEKQFDDDMSFFSPEENIDWNAIPDYEFKFDMDSITIMCPPNCNIPCDSMRICQPFNWSGEGFEEKESAFLGVMPSGDDDEPGIAVTIVDESSAQKMGLENGDIITEFNGSLVNNFEQLSELITIAEPGSIVTIKYLRQGKQKETSGELGKRTFSGRDEIRIFHDYKGMDEDGNYFFDYEFDMDEGDLQERMEDLMQMLEDQQMQIEEEQERLQGRMDELQNKTTRIEIQISISDITSDEAAVVNQNPKAKLETSNNLELDQISFFPNPGNGMINLNFKPAESGDVSIFIYDSSGNIVYLEQLNDFSGAYNNIIDISNQAEGSYFMQITQNGKSYSKKIVKGE